jgi:hypothetical protein
MPSFENSDDYLAWWWRAGNSLSHFLCLCHFSSILSSHIVVVVQFLDEAERSIHDAIMVVRRTAKYNTVVAGGGALEMEVSSYLREQAKQFPDKQQNIVLVSTSLSFFLSFSFSLSLFLSLSLSHFRTQSLNGTIRLVLHFVLLFFFVRFNN